MKTIIISLIILLGFILLISDFNEQNNTLTYILFILIVKITGITLATIGINLLPKPQS